MAAARAKSPWRLVDPFAFRHFFYGAWRDGDRLAVVGGCSLGKPAPIVLSEDGGATWSLADFTSRRDFLCVTADARGDLWVGGAKGTLLVRRDGRWKRVKTTLTEGISRVWCAAPDAVYVCSHKGALARSLDGGRRWEVIESGASASLRAVCGDGAGAFVAVGDSNAVVRSDDGARWAPVPFGDGLREAAAHNGLRAVRAFGPGRFLAGGEGCVLRSDDGGRTWRDVTPACLAGRAWVTSLCVTARGTWYVATLERVARSDDEGATWALEHEMEGPLHRWVYALDVGDDGRGVAAGPHGTAYLRAPT